MKPGTHKVVKHTEETLETQAGVQLLEGVCFN